MISISNEQATVRRQQQQQQTPQQQLELSQLSTAPSENQTKFPYSTQEISSSCGDETRELINKSTTHCCAKLCTEMPESTRLISAYFLAELIGTFLLVVIGDGTIASYVLSKREVDFFSTSLAFGVGAMIATFSAAKISGAHINPAASLAFALDGRLKWKLVPFYMCAQYLGGFLGALVLFMNYAEAINALDGGIRSAYGSSNSTGNIFATYPGPWVSVWGTLLDQILGTAVLLFSLSAVTDKNNAGLEERHQPFIVALVIGLVCAAFSPNCGAIFNPARDLAPRLLTALFGYSSPSVWAPVQGLYWLTAGVVGPHIGAIVGVFAYKLLISHSLSHKRDCELKTINFEQKHQQMHQHQHQHQNYHQQQEQTSKFAQQQHHYEHTAATDIQYGAAKR